MLLNLNVDILGFFVLVLHLVILLIIHELRVIVGVVSYSVVGGSPSDSPTTTDLETKEQLEQSLFSRQLRLSLRMRFNFWHDLAMILDKMKFLFRLNLGNFSSDVHVSEHMLYFAELFFDVSEDGR